MGPLAGVDLLNKILTLVDAKKDQDYPHIILDSNSSIQDRTNHILNKTNSPLPAILESAIRLENAGADLLIMACNTAHYYYSDIIKHINIPLINMIEETAKTVLKSNYKRICLLSTVGTQKAGVYKTVFDNYNIPLISLNETDQSIITDIIYNGVKPNVKDYRKDDFVALIDRLKNDCDVFILGCTELPIAFTTYNIDANSIDPTLVLAISSLENAEVKMINN